MAVIKSRSVRVSAIAVCEFRRCGATIFNLHLCGRNIIHTNETTLLTELDWKVKLIVIGDRFDATQYQRLTIKVH